MKSVDILGRKILSITLLTMIFLSGILPIVTLSGSVPDDEYWDDQFHYSGVYGTVYAIAVNGSKVYVGGEFTAVDDGSIPASNIAVWDDDAETWDPLGIGTDGVVKTIAIGDSGELYIGGEFSSAGGVPVNNIVEYNSVTGLWSPLGGGITGDYGNVVKDLWYSDGWLYVGGRFSRAGGSNINNLARWDGTNWYSLNWRSASIEAVAVYEDYIYVGSRSDCGFGYIAYARVGNHPNWSRLDDGLDGPVLDLDVLPGGRIAVVGEFQKSSAILLRNVAVWGGSTFKHWYPSYGGTNIAVHAVATLGNEIYVGGEFEYAGGVKGRNLVAMLDYSPPQHWEALGEGIEDVFNSVVYAAAVADDGSVFYGGEFEATGDSTAYNIVKWNGEKFSSLGSGPANGIWSRTYSTSVYDMTGEKEILVGGEFSRIGTIEAQNFAIFNSETNEWSSPGIKFKYRYQEKGTRVSAIAVNGSIVYLSGRFDRIILTDGTELYMRGLARWDRETDTWSRVNFIRSVRNVESLEYYGDHLYIGGDFYDYGSINKGGIVRWNGTHTEHFGYGTGGSGTVRDIEFINGAMYIGGSFYNVYNPDGSTVRVNNIAKWNDESWETVGNLLQGQISKITQYNGKIIAGGSIYYSVDDPATPLHNLVILDENNWATFNGGAPYGYVTDIEVTGSTMYVAGGYSQIGDIEAENIAKWRGNSWEPLGSGTNERIFSIHESRDIYVGGWFTEAGDKPSFHIGRWMILNTPPDCSNAYPSIDLFWPPNHKMVEIDIMGVVDPDGDPVTITVTGVWQDEPTEEQGDGKSGPDAVIYGDFVEVRAERSGVEDGRVYHIYFTAEDDKGGICTGEVTVGVPHDKKDDPVDGGALYDSLI